MTENHSFEEGGKSCLTLAGLGKLAPNMLLIGFKTNWSKDLDNAAQYFNILEVSWEVNTQKSEYLSQISAKVFIVMIHCLLILYDSWLRSFCEPKERLSSQILVFS